MDKNYKIYGLKLKNTNEIKYIGYTGKLLKERLYEHLAKTIKGKYKNAYWINKYKDEIEIILLKDNIETQGDACSEEINFIKYFKELGYNLNNTTDGGEGFRGKHSEETKDRLRKINLGKKHSEESKKKMSDNNPLKGKKLPEDLKRKMIENNINNKGKILSNEIKEKISKSLKGRCGTNNQKIEAYDYKTGDYIGKYESHADCARKLNINGGHISQVVSGKRNHTHGYIFKKIST